MKLNKQTEAEFSVITKVLGVVPEDLIDYINWCLIEHLVVQFSENPQIIDKLRNEKDGLNQFRQIVEHKTHFKWDVDNLGILFERVKKNCEKHYRKPIPYDELVRLLINQPYKCVHCGREPPEVKLHIDHYFPASKEDPDIANKADNLQFLCADCNLKKSDKLWRNKLWLKLESLQPC